MAREINLVPDIKDEMIRTLKLRNLIFFICLIVASASVAVSVIFGVSSAIQQAVVDGKKGTIDLLSKKVNSYSDLGDFLTIKDQLGNISSVSDNKLLLSRSFGALSAILPTGSDTVSVSKLEIDFAGGIPTFSFDAQANAGSYPFIDYNVLDSFKKSMQYMRYDYGNYVDRNGTVIPSYCIIESGNDGATFRDAEKGYYALWLINGKGCNPSAQDSEDSEGEDENDDEEDENEEENIIIDGYSTEKYEEEPVVRIWRTPQYDDWYKEKEVKGEPYMDISGQISNVPHFESSCTTYSGLKKNNNSVSWTSTNETCLLVPDGVDGIEIRESSNGRDTSSELVLRFSAKITFDAGFFNFNNHHALALAPSNRINVTDSYVQIQNIFAAPATDCAEDDSTCSDDKTNLKGN